MIKMIKTAISMPREDFELIELLRKKTNKSRSQILVEAFHSWIKARREVEVDATYAEAYRKMPDHINEIQGLMKAGSSLWTEENW